MARHDKRRFGRLLHIVVGLLILLSGGALLGTGLWMRLTGSGGPLNLDYSGDSFFRIVLSADIGCLILGSLLLFTGTISLLTLFCDDRRGRGVRITYVLMACIMVAMLTVTCVVSSMIVAYDDRAEVRQFIERAWERSVRDDVETVCDIEERLGCRGLEDGQCEMCDNASGKRRIRMKMNNERQTKDDGCKCAVCSVKEMESEEESVKRDGCYDAIVKHFRKLFLPWAVGSAVLGAVVVMDIFVTWCI